MRVKKSAFDRIDVATSVLGEMLNPERQIEWKTIFLSGLTIEIKFDKLYILLKCIEASNIKTGDQQMNIVCSFVSDDRF